MYELGSGSVSEVGNAATNIADSMFAMIGDLLPVLVPVIVIMFAISLILGLIKRR